MNPTAVQLAQSLAEEAARELEDAQQRIRHCVEQLDDEQTWWRPAPQLNSIATLLLHLNGNLRQWIVSGIGGAQDVRDRPREFAERGPLSRQELLDRLQATIREARSALRQATPAQLLRVRRIQGFDVSGTQAIIECVAHFRGHTQEIVHITRCQLGEAYRFAFVPQTPEQGAPTQPPS